MGITRKSVRWSPHALDALIDRKVERLEAAQAIARPEFVVLDPPTGEVYMRRYFDALLGQEMLIRVVVEETDNELIEITVYKTSHGRRYLRGLLP